MPKPCRATGHDEGGKAWGRTASLIETAKIKNVEPFAYLKATLEAIAAGHPQHRIYKLLPWNFQPSSSNPSAFQTPLTVQRRHRPGHSGCTIVGPHVWYQVT
jgi:hypothetical protein